MIISIEIGYYPLASDYSKAVDTFLKKISHTNLDVEIGKMSTIISGEYDAVMSLLSGAMKELMEQYPSVFTLKISNTCEVR